MAEERRDSYLDGAWLVELSGERNGDLLPHTVAAVLGLREESARPQHELLVEFLAGKKLLLLLDTCEHLLPACRELVAAILARAPGVRIVATSRQPLGLPGEAVLPVEPFAVPSSASSASSASSTSPVSSAGAPGDRRGTTRSASSSTGRRPRRPVWPRTRPGCGPPYGSAGVWAASPRRRAGGRAAADPAPDLLAERLDGRFAALSANRALVSHHQTLRTAVSWTHDLCSREERLLWSRLSVFAGPFDAEAAVWVCGDEHLPNVPDTLADLVKSSLLIPVPGGYRQLDTVREYGRELLARLGDERRLALRHRHYYLNLARRADENWYGPDQEEWARSLNFSITNLRLALDSDPRPTPCPSSSRGPSGSSGSASAACRRAATT
nr:hypothetical protein GCM10020093_087120 [Planobispora longispora]